MVIENKFQEILLLLKGVGIMADEEDLKAALDVRWIMSELDDGPGSVRYSPSPSAAGQIRPPAACHFDLGLELQKGLVKVVNQIDRGYERVMTMYTIAFYLGVVMVLASLIASVAMRSDASKLVLGGLGMIDIIAYLIFRPAQDLQNSRGNLAQLQAAFFNWINDIHNWDRYLQLVDEEATANKHPPVFDRVREVSDMMLHNTERMMRLVERYCEIYAKPPLRKKPDQAEAVVK
jgi:hypothetical protein